jgi:hypothetical protein
MAKKYQNLREFYPFYLLEHQNFISRCLHFIGTGGFLSLLAYALISQTWWLLALCPVMGYGFAWVGHFFFEKNRPATFTYPAMSLVSDFIMFYHILTFQIGAKIAQAKEIMQAQQ